MSTSKKNGGKTAASAKATTDKSTVTPAATTEATAPVKPTRLQLLTNSSRNCRSRKLVCVSKKPVQTRIRLLWMPVPSWI